MRAFLEKTYDAQVAALFSDARRPYRLSLVTNASPDTAEVVAKESSPRSTEIREKPLGLAWPPQIFSLSHLAVPFAVDDPLFGIEPDLRVDYGLRLGKLAPRGERGVLDVSTDQFMRLNCNPFFPYLERRMIDFLGSGL